MEIACNEYSPQIPYKQNKSSQIKHNAIITIIYVIIQWMLLNSMQKKNKISSNKTNSYVKKAI